MKQSLSLKLTALLILALFAVKGFADEDQSDQEKLSAATDQSGGCVLAKDFQNTVINYEGDEASLNAQLATYWKADARRQGNGLKCLAGINIAIDNLEETEDESFTGRMKARVQNLMSTLSGLINRQRPEDLRLNGPVVAVGIRG